MYDTGEKPTLGIHADPSITRIKFKQFREWVLQPASKADTHRLNLEYIDIVIDYILSLLQQPRISDDGVDPTTLQIEKDTVKTVNFDSIQHIIPEDEPDYDDDILQDFEEMGEGWQEEQATVGGTLEERGENDGSAARERSVITVQAEVHDVCPRDEPVNSHVDTGSKSKGGAARERSVITVQAEVHDVCPRDEPVNSHVSTSTRNEGGAAQDRSVITVQAEVHNVCARDEPVNNHVSTGSNLSVGTGLGDTATDEEVASSNCRPALHVSRTTGNDSVEATVKGSGSHSHNLDSTPSEQEQNNAPMQDSDPGSAFARDSIEYDDDRLRRFAHEYSSMEPPTGSDVTAASQAVPPQAGSTDSQQGMETSVTDGTPRPKSPPKTSAPSESLVFNQSRVELSRLLIEKMPSEILKRMVIRWPVGDEHPRDRSELNRNRLTIAVWDVAGDPVQQNFTPFFFSDRCMYVAMYNLSKVLNGPCESYVMKGLSSSDGSVPTNAEVYEGWIGCVTAFSKDLPSEPFRCTKHTPVLPPLILACTHVDELVVRENPVLFYDLFNRKSFDSYKRHLVESTSPCALRISNKYENDDEEGYSGHHMLRREIDYLARQMPYACDSIPVQWVKFEQLVYGLQEQKKVILLYDDLAKYISEHCKISGPLQILPVLSHFHDVGVISYFYRHPELSNLVITKPQWLIDALGTMIVSNPSRWVTVEVQNAFEKLYQEGAIGKDMLQLAYRCARMPQRYWNEMLFILNYMDLICCHPALHVQNAIYLPCMVTQTAVDPLLIPTEDDPAMLQFSAKNAAIPIALYNQLVVSCVRSCTYTPVIRHQQAHFRLDKSHHLILMKQHTAILFIVQKNCEQFCHACKPDEPKYTNLQECSQIHHLMGQDAEFMPSDNIATLIKVSKTSTTRSNLHLALSDRTNSLSSICPRVLQCLTKNVQFLCHCWFPGLNLELFARSGEETIVLNQYWKHTVLQVGEASPSISVWFSI